MQNRFSEEVEAQVAVGAHGPCSVLGRGEHVGDVEGGVVGLDVLPERLGHQLSATLWLTLALKDIDCVGERIGAHGRIAFAGATSGSKNLVAIAICRDTRDLYRYLSEQLGQIEEILNYEVNVRTQRLKQHGSIVAHGRLVNPRPTRAAR